MLLSIVILYLTQSYDIFIETTVNDKKRVFIYNLENGRLHCPTTHSQTNKKDLGSGSEY